MGAGKTAVGRELAKLTGGAVADTDELIEKEQGICISEIFEKYGEQYFRDLEYDACKKLAREQNIIISTGGGAMTFERNVEAIKKNAAVVFIDTPFDIICKRVGNASGRPLFKDRENARRLYNERRGLYIKAADYVADGSQSVKKTALQILKMVK